MAKTSKAARLEEFKILDLLATNGRLLTWKEIKRFRLLRHEFADFAPQYPTKQI